MIDFARRAQEIQTERYQNDRLYRLRYDALQVLLEQYPQELHSAFARLYWETIGRSAIKQFGTVQAWFRRNENSPAEQKTCHYAVLEVLENGNQLFQLIGGSTGYESFYLENVQEKVENFQKAGYWSACAGGSGWTECRIHANEMVRILKEIPCAR